MKLHNFLAFDVGATSGRAILFSFENGELSTREIVRFPNSNIEILGKCYWNIYNLHDSFKTALTICANEKIAIDSIGIDTWGVDFGYLATDGTLLSLPRTYRDPYTQNALEEYFKVMPSEELYQRTGIQILNFNSIFQLFSAQREHFSPMTNSSELLFVPDLLSYLLTGKRVCEYTIASTSQILNAKSKSFDTTILKSIGIEPTFFSRIVQPATLVGNLTPAIALETGIGEVPVVAVAGHDTASAVIAIPAENEKFAYLSSGTWSLMGIEVDQPIITDQSQEYNFTNEGGIEGTTRFLKNITGMWLLEQCIKSWKRDGFDYSYEQIIEMAQAESSFSSIINPDHARFHNPQNMELEIINYCKETSQPIPKNRGQLIQCIFLSLANRYAEVLTALRQMSPFEIDKLHVIGGGSKNGYLNQLIADAIRIPVIAGPAEATATGNAMMQAKFKGLFANRWEIRNFLSKHLSLKTFTPRPTYKNIN